LRAVDLGSATRRRDGGDWTAGGPSDGLASTGLSLVLVSVFSGAVFSAAGLSEPITDSSWFSILLAKFPSLPGR
jgi:hypothetical protein